MLDFDWHGEIHEKIIYETKKSKTLKRIVAEKMSQSRNLSYTKFFDVKGKTNSGKQHHLIKRHWGG